MLKMKIGFKALSLAFIGGTLFLSPAHAIDVEKPLPKRSAKEVLLAGPSSAFFAEFDQAIEGDCKPLLSHLEKALNSGDSVRDYSAKLVYAEMYDRAICVPYQPTKSFDLFKEIAKDGNPHFNLQVGWKYLFGHGVPQSNERATVYFKRYLISVAVKDPSEIIKQTEALLSKRPMPEPLVLGIHWYEKITSDKQTYLAFEKSLLQGNGKYFDGSFFEVDKNAIYMSLLSLSFHDIEAAYVLYVEKAKGTFGPQHKIDGQLSLEQVARCGYVPAMLKLAEFASSTDKGLDLSAKDTYGWYLMAEENGANVSNELEKARKNAGPYFQFSAPKNWRYKVNLKKCKFT
jgi:hypothetical protein